MLWLSAGLAVVCLVLALLHLLRLALLRNDVAEEGSSAAMGLGMAAMLSPLGNPLPQPVWAAVFVVCAAWFGTLVLRAGTRSGDTIHHAVGSIAMLFMLSDGHLRAAFVDGGARGHAAHDGGVTVGLGLALAAAIVLVECFAWRVRCCADRCREVPRHQRGGPVANGTAVNTVATRVSTRRTVTVKAAAHVVMAASMVVMLVGIV